jgi:hypothetical protein
MGQNALTVITRVRAEESAALETLLDQIGNHIKDNDYICFARITSLHFACWALLNNDPNFAPTLVLETSYDGALEDHLQELIREGGRGLDAIYSRCEGYPASGVSSPAQVLQYLRAHAVASPAFYIGCPGQTVGSIRNAIAVREEIETFLDAETARGALSGLSASQVYARIVQYIEQEAAVKPQRSPTTLDAQLARSHRNLLLLILVAVPVLLLLSPLLLVWLILLRMHEQKDAKTPVTPLPIDRRLFEKEDIFVQNHLTTLVNVRPGAFRLWTLKAILWIVSLLARTYFITGNLGGIPTIHFARWILMDNDRRLLFFSNYDGSWASYLGDFVDKANYGLTAVWSNTESFPPASFLFFGGAQHIEAFKQWSREHNVYAAVWYSAYPDETIVNLRNDVQIRDTLGKPLSDDEAKAFLQRF